MKIKIISDGTPKNTKIVNAETGEKISGAKFIQWEISYDGLSKCTVIFNNIPAEIRSSFVEITEHGDENRRYINREEQ